MKERTHPTSSQPCKQILVKDPKQIKIGGNPTSWKDLMLKAEVQNAIHDLGYKRPSEVQLRVLPALINGHNVIYQAKSGMGKTSVFVIGILNSMALQANKQYCPHQCIVLAHTRQLAYQIYQEFKKHGIFFKSPQVRYSCFFGGTSIQKDMDILCDKEHTPHIIISTIGRLLDLIQRGCVNLKLCKYFVIDECDYMLNQQQSLKEVKYLVSKLKKKTQKIMLSATIDEKIVTLCKQLMENVEPTVIKIDQGKITLTGLSQFYKILANKDKFEVLQRILDAVPFDQGIIFANKIQRVNKISDLLDQILFFPIRIHSGLSQQERLKCYDEFKTTKSRLLVATNLFGRGIDIQKVNLVINYDFPFDKQTYLHRVGRAGRYGGKGVVINFLRNDPDENGQSDQQNMKKFCKDMNLRINKLPNNFDVAQFL